MSRSYKKAYAYFACCNSQKQWRSDYNRRFRHTENQRVQGDPEYLCYRNPYKFMYADPWCGPTDGKAYRVDPIEDTWDTEWVKRRVCKFKKHGCSLFHK